MDLVIRRSARRRTLGLRVTRDGVTLHAPPHVPEEDLLRWAATKREWIEQARRHFAVRTPPLYTFTDGEVVPFLGEILRVRHTTGRDVVRTGGTLEVPGGNARAAALAWYRREALAFFEPLSRSMSDRLGREVRGVRLTNATTRWGSCTADGVLRFNPRILLASREEAEYLCAHEVAHLRELNHSPRFWRHVAHLMPNYHGPRERLRREGWRYTFGSDQGTH